MSNLARKLEVTDPMEERIARLETHTAHLQENVRRIEHKIDNKIEPKIDALAEKLDAFKESVAKRFDGVGKRFDGVWKRFDDLTNALSAFRLETKTELAALRLEMQRGRWADRVWWLLISGALLGVMARGFKWL